MAGVSNIDDPVKAPAHYLWLPGIEAKAVTAWFDFLRGSALKYIWRSGRKPGETEARALEKAIECLQDRLDVIRGASADELRAIDDCAK